MATNGRPVSYAAEIVRKNDGVGFGRRPVPASYLESARDQITFLAQREGIADADPSDVTVIEEPVFNDETTGEVSGVKMAVERDGGRIEHEFGLTLFEPFGQKIGLELLEAKQLDGSSDVKLRVFAQAPDDSAEDGDRDARIERQALPFIDGRLDEFLPEATLVGPQNEADYPVFVRQSVLDKAHEFVWERNRERGVWLVGNLYRQREPKPEIFCVIHSVFEARGTTHERFSIDFTTETFTHAQQQLSLRQNRLGRAEDLLVGFYHTHPFLPSILDGKEACPSCELREHCTLTSSFFSQRDRMFHTAFFGSASSTYAVEFVLGLTPREEFDLKLFCMDGGKIRERGYYRLAETPAAVASS